MKLMLLVFNCLIEIGSLKMTFFNEVEINSSWKEMTDTAVIKIPKKVFVKGSDNTIISVADAIKTGDKVVIKLGYDGKLRTEFVGHVSRSPIPGIPLTINCEDEMWKLKRMPVKQRVFANAKLSDVVEYIIPGIQSSEYSLLDTTLGANYSCLDQQDGSAAGALKRIEETFGLKSFFRLVEDDTSVDGVRKVLVIGRPYGSNDLIGLEPIKYRLHENNKSDSLEYQFAEDRIMQIKGIVKVEKAKDLTYEYPSDLIDAEIHTIHYFDISMAELMTLVKADYIKMKADGYTGQINGFGIPYVRHGMAVNIVDETYEKRDSTHFVDAVNVKVSNSGFERSCTVGYTANADTHLTSK